MENASKALIMAGSMLVSLIVLSLLVMMFNNISGVKRADAESTATLQASEFNKPYLAYERNLYGSELFSLANLVQDYNKNRIKNDDGYKDIDLKIKFSRNFDAEYFKQNKTGYTQDEFLTEINRLDVDLNGVKGVGGYANAMITITPDTSDKSFKVKVKNIANMTMSTVMSQYNISASTYNTVVLDNADYKKYNEYKGLPERIKSAKFKCEDFIYDKKTGRIEKIVFSLIGE